jgi:hypothetical protein
MSGVFFADSPETSFPRIAMNTSHEQNGLSLRMILTVFGLIACFFLVGHLWDTYASSASVLKPHIPVTSKTPAGVRFAKIQEIQVGERTVGKNPEILDEDRRAFFPDPDPSTWRKLTLEMLKPDGKRLDITLLRPLTWIEESSAEPGATIYLDLAELGAQGNAKVIAVEPCPPIKPGKGNVVTGTFHHEAANTIDLYVDSVEKPIGTTDNHPFWSVTKQEFFEAGKLLPGEELQLHSGQTAKVVQLLPRPGPERVHNLEVLNEHVYQISEHGILVHNDCVNLNIKGLGRTKNVPKKAYTALFLYAQNPQKTLEGFAPPKKYHNTNGQLPNNGDYMEYDIERTYEFSDRGTRRIVLDIKSGRAWYTNDHYDTFREM